MRALLLSIVLLGGAACDPETKDRKEPAHEVERARRVIEPPVGIVRPLPPFLISATGVGPYRLGDRLADILQQLPTGPRIAMFEIPSVLHRSLIRAEEGDSIRVGGEPNGTATSVAVVDATVARTESGLHVGATRAELEKSGIAPPELDRAHDPRFEIAASPKGARVLFDPDATRDRIAAIVVTSDAPTTTPAPTEPACARPVPPNARRSRSSASGVFGACLTGIEPGELVVVAGNDLAVRSVESDKLVAPLRILATIVFAAPLRVDGRDELVIVTRTDEPQLRTWSLLAYRFEGGKLTKTADAPLYAVSTTNARWIGVELSEIDLYLELAATGDAFEVGGLLTTRADLPDAPGPWRDVVMISPVSVPRRHDKPTKPPVTTPDGSASGGAPDASVESAGSNP